MPSHSKNSPKENLRKAIQIAEEKGEDSLFVFDLDSTLFCMKYRTQAIIRDCAKDDLFIRRFAKSADIIRRVEAVESDWSVQEIMSRYGFSPEDPLTLAVEKIWRDKFFSADYLHLDRPYKACPEFVQHISRLGAPVRYLTARKRSVMEKGAAQSLKTWNFPLADKRHLIMKEDPKKGDTEHKMEHLKKLDQKFKTILFFENEPVTLNKAEAELSRAQLFWIDSAHSRQAEPPKSALRLSMDYTWR